MLRLRLAVALAREPHVEPSPSQRLALEVLRQALADRAGRRELFTHDFLPWLELAGIDPEHFRRSVFNARERRRYLALLDELLEEDAALPVAVRRKE